LRLAAPRGLAAALAAAAPPEDTPRLPVEICNSARLDRGVSATSRVNFSFPAAHGGWMSSRGQTPRRPLRGVQLQNRWEGGEGVLAGALQSEREEETRD